MKNRPKVNKKYLKITGFLILFLALPLTLILIRQTQDSRSSAAAPDMLEVETGTLNSNAQVVIDTTASGGKYVTF
jgi:hypothetical protein